MQNNVPVVNVMKNKAIFLDRDGVINKEKDYVYKIDDFAFIDGVVDACLKLVSTGYKIIVITNQAGIGRGYYTEKDFGVLTDWMLVSFKKLGVSIDAVYFCPHHPVYGQGDYLINCQCRKPEPGMIIKAAAIHNLDLEHSFLVGDKLSDIKAGQAAGVGQNYFVRTGKLIPQKEGALADGIFDTLYDVVNFISSKQ